MRTCGLFRTPEVILAYVHVLNDKHYIDLANRFIGTYRACPPGADHDTIVICNNGKPSAQTRELFKPLPHLSFFEHNNSGYDIGGYIALARQLEEGPMFCCGSSAHFRKPGWLGKMMEAWRRFGPGVYGSLATYEVRPHFCTTGFLVPAEVLNAYPYRVREVTDRYAFEHGPRSLVNFATDHGLPTNLVTWDGVYDRSLWRKPANIYVSGDQSNCLTFFKHSDSYETSSNPEKLRRKKLADHNY